jgi:uncharacterized protein (TIGR02611 family)
MSREKPSVNGSVRPRHINLCGEIADRNISSHSTVITATALAGRTRYNQAAGRVERKLEMGFIDNLPLVKKVVVAILGTTVVLIGVALLVLPGPGLVVITLGLALLATEFVWAKSLLKKAQAAAARTAQKVRSTVQR